MNLTDIATVRTLMESHGVSFQKQFGQNFLINPALPQRIAASCEEVDTLIEIGPGIGTLTRELAGRARKVVAFEIDRGLIPILAETLADKPNVEVVEGDFMKIDPVPYLEGRTGVCANLPYYITTPILMKLLESRLPFAYITVMMQKEVAQRLASRPGEDTYGAVTLSLDYFATIEKLFTVSPGNFLPAPKVESTVVRITPRSERPTVSDEALLFSLIRASFAQRRKTLLNSLSSVGFPKDKLTDALSRVAISPSARGENLSLADFISLTDALKSEN